MKKLVHTLTLALPLISASLFVTPSNAIAEPSADAVYQVSKMVNINKADVNELMELKGLGQNKAKRIIEYRQANGPFKNIDQLLKVKGIGPSFIKKNKSLITL
ncbi:ComEA family DNA-binding protein [Paraferrimonas sp. SM1919]|uniref:ComEA family DNA-binding protein n=1 Tax=Paraferrimonas sp. SM1919 TaxID=2662263 RepID=UPI0013D2E0DF|nr:ComEA family DNA-binding protein [Paraferrimonas sp. SM1919]